MNKIIILVVGCFFAHKQLVAQITYDPDTKNAGINTTTPAYRLEVNTSAGSEQSSVGVQQVNSTGNPINQPTSRLIYNWYSAPRAAVNFHRGGSSNDGFISFSTTADGSALQERMRIGTYGNVGVGTISPQGLFDVNGAAWANSFSARQYISAWALDAIPGDKFTYDSKDMPNYGVKWAYDSWTSIAPTQWLSGFGGIKFFTQSQPRMVIHSSGNVGIGTIAPAAPLDLGNPVENTLSAVLGRLPEGNSTSSGTYLGVRNIGTSPVNTTSFSLEHRFYGVLNSSINFNRGAAQNGGFLSFATNDGTEKMRLDAGGNLCIGTGTAQSKLTVNGDITARKVKVTAQGWADYVFDSTYTLKPLDKVHSFIKENKHLPDMPSAKEIENSGLDLAEMVKQQQIKIEELTLYLIELKKENTQLTDMKIMIQQQAAQIAGLQKKLETVLQKNDMISTTANNKTTCLKN